LGRSFSRSAEQEDQVIRARFAAYWDLPAKKFETKGPVDALVDDLVANLLPNIRLQPTARVSSSESSEERARRG